MNPGEDTPVVHVPAAVVLFSVGLHSTEVQLHPADLV